MVRLSTQASMLEGLRLGSRSRAPFSLDECRRLLDYLEKPENLHPSISRAPLLSEAASETHLISWILLHAGQSFKLEHPSDFLPRNTFSYVAITEIHISTTKHGVHTRHKHERSLQAYSNQIWFLSISWICFGVPFIHREHISLAQESSELRGDERTWPAYVESLVQEWSTFNLAVSVTGHA